MERVTVILTAAGEGKLEVINAIRVIAGFDLRRSKAIVDSATMIIKKGASVAEANDIKARLENIGAKVEIIVDIR